MNPRWMMKLHTALSSFPRRKQFSQSGFEAAESANFEWIMVREEIILEHPSTIPPFGRSDSLIEEDWLFLTARLLA